MFIDSKKGKGNGYLSKSGKKTRKSDCFLKIR